MPESFENIELNTQEVQDILSRIPHWLIRWGSLIILIVLFIFFLISCFLKYPTIITGNVILTTANQPVKVVNKMAGKIERLYCKENTDVKVGNELALIENPISYQSINFLRRIVSKTYLFLDGKSSGIDSLDTFMSFGYQQNEYNNLIKKIKDYQFFKDNEFYFSKIKVLEEQIDHYKTLEEITKDQLLLSTKELSNSNEKYKVEKKLFEERINTKLDFIKAENDFIKEQMELGGLKKYLEEVRITKLEYLKQLNEIEHNWKQNKLDHIQAIQNSLKIIESAVSTWQQDYIIGAPISGKIFFLKNVIEKEFFDLNQELFVIVPANQNYICMMHVSALGFGKIKEGQKVRIKLDNFPAHEYGQLIGKIKYVPKIPIVEKVLNNNNESVIQYRLIVELINTNKTTYNKALSFNPEMTGTGEIMTNKLTLLERFFNQLRGNLDNQASE